MGLDGDDGSLGRIEKQKPQTNPFQLLMSFFKMLARKNGINLICYLCRMVQMQFVHLMQKLQ